MKALQLAKAHAIEENPLRMCDLDTPKPSEQDLLIKVRACGVCHTDLHLIEGELPLKKLPIIPGHQVVGVVEKTGSKVKSHKIGDRVGVAWLNWTCGVCEFCIRGEENLCTEAMFTGYDVDGGYAEYITVQSDFAYPIPLSFSDENAAPLLCAGIIGYRALRLSNIRAGEKLGLFGFGASAHITIQVARYKGCEVYVFSRNERHRKHAEQLGAVWTGSINQTPPHLLHSAISFAPAGDIVPKALSVLQRGGTLALAGVYVSSIPAFDYELLYHERIVRSVANNTRSDALEFLKIASEIPVKTEIEVFSISEANKVLKLLKDSQIQGAGVLKI